jgi:signal transduction histidine kinase
MVDLASWIEANADELIRSATETLSQNQQLQMQAVEAVEMFYDALLRAARTYDPTPLYKILFDWADTKSGSIGEESASLVPVLAQLKLAMSEQVYQLCTPDAAIGLLLAADSIYTDAMVFLSSIEAEALSIRANERLYNTQKQIEKLTKSKSDFINIAGHELKTPLTVIEGYMGMMVQSPGVTQDDMLPALCLGIETGIGRLRQIVEDLIDVSMIDLKLLELHFQPVWVNHLLDALQRGVGDYLAQRNLNLQIEWHTMPSRPTYADPERLLQVLTNVVTNAIKYTPDGGEILVSGRILTGFLDVMVRDAGIGMNASQLNHIFDAFSSVGDVSLHSSGKVKFKGSGPGLGLPIARGIIEAHGGSIWAQSPGYNEQTCPGSTFHIMIPLREPPDDPVHGDS